MKGVSTETLKYGLLALLPVAGVAILLTSTPNSGGGEGVEPTSTPLTPENYRVEWTPTPGPGSIEPTPTPPFVPSGWEWCTDGGNRVVYRPPTVIDGIEVSPGGYICASAGYYAPAQP